MWADLHLSLLLAYRPFLEPLPIDDYWLWGVVPVVLAVCLVYKLVKDEDLDGVFRRAVGLTTQVLLFMALAAAVLWVVTELM